jgi:hypothetical protein
LRKRPAIDAITSRAEKTFQALSGLPRPWGRILGVLGSGRASSLYLRQLREKGHIRAAIGEIHSAVIHFQIGIVAKVRAVPLVQIDD